MKLWEGFVKPKIYVMDIGKAVKALNEGKMVKRQEWEDMFIFQQVPSEVKKDVVPRMTSLPQAVKSQFERRFDNPERQISSIYYTDQIALVQQSNLITSWSPTVIDLFADDWEIYESLG